VKTSEEIDIKISSWTWICCHCHRRPIFVSRGPCMILGTQS